MLAQILIKVFLIAAFMMSASAWAGPAGNCAFDLMVGPTQSEAKALFTRFKRENLKGEAGWKFYSGIPAGRRTVTLDLGTETIPKLTRWNYNGIDYDFANVGYLNFEPLAKRMNYALAVHALLYPNETLNLKLSPRWHATEEYLHDWHYALMKSVKEVYRQKSYLNDEDFYLMDQIGAESTNTDAFVLLRGPGRRREPLVTMQVRYFGNRNFFRPSLRGVFDTWGLTEDESEDLLPFEYRLLPGARRSFREKVYSYFPRETSCEMIRYSKFSWLPPPVIDKFILSVFEQIQERGMRTILISTDEISMRLFHRYGFRKFWRLPVRQKMKPEFLGFLRVNSELFQNELAELRARVAAVETLRVPLVKPYAPVVTIMSPTAR